MNQPVKTKCPTCQAEVIWSEENEYRPFCSKRCQLIDLGEWANENHSIPASPELGHDFEDFDNPLPIDRDDI